MTTNSRRAWKTYFILAIILTVDRAYGFFTPDTPEHLYFSVLNAFHPDFSLFCILAILQIALNVFHWLPLALYILERRLGPPFFWQIMFVLRAILDVTGNSYARNILFALYRNNPLLCVLTLLFLALPYAPWYWACFRYAFIRTQDCWKKSG